ncbi:MAG TPA: LamG-like jellyroll fold domain-containing protein [Methylomirabilota bacterium]|nr:LamG-like jellyroll fold domain-containing protein [Methylomirabilota bacterium]
MAVFAAPALAQLPVPAIIETRFEEGGGSAVTNSGTVGGMGTIDFGLVSSTAGLPAFTNNVPAGPFAPGGNFYSLSFGTSAGHAPYAGKAVDFPDSVRTNTVGLTQFTLAGWINVTDGTIGGGGNRIFSTWPQNVNGVTANRLTGVDLVVESTGRLRLGVNQAPDFPTPPTGPFSSANRVTISASANPTNWLFIAVTYDASQAGSEVKYYFGRADALASLDLSASYARGMVTNCTVPVTLTLGNFMDTPPLLSARDSTSASRAFRGLMDEIRFFTTALTAEQIQQVQTAGGSTNVLPAGFALEPVSRTVLETQPANFSVIVTGTPPLSVQWQRNSNDIVGATSSSYSIPAASVADNGAYFRVVISNSLGQVFSSNALLTVITDIIPPAVLSVTPARSARNLTNLTVKFSEPVNIGSAQELGNYILNDGNLNIYDAVLQPDLTTVLLTVDALIPDAAHTLSISAVGDRAGTINVMTTTNWTFFGPPSILPPIVELRFEEGTGTTTTNTGTFAGSAIFVQQNTYPNFSTNVPSGAYAPAANIASVDFGDIVTGEGGRAIDLTTATGPSGTLGALNGFTVCGWVNARNLNEGFGGNRIAFALASGNGPGFDIVQLSSGALRVGINQWPDGAGGGGPFSTVGKITADPAAGPGNWVFFAVTYDSAVTGGEVRYYFGKSDQPASLDVAAPYARGPIVTSGTLSAGNFSTVDTGARTGVGPSGPSRVFRGLIDELQVFDEAFSLEQIQQLQLAATAGPTLTAERGTNEMVISWRSSSNYQLMFRTNLSLGTWENVITGLETNGTLRTVRQPFTGSSRFYQLQRQ